MGKYSCSLMPLLANLSKEEDGIPKPKQVWYADDAAGGGKIKDLESWWNKLCSTGPLFGYYPKPSKTWVIVKSEHYEAAKEAFPDLNITTVGHKYLGSYFELIWERKRSFQEKLQSFLLYTFYCADELYA